MSALVNFLDFLLRSKLQNARMNPANIPSKTSTSSSLAILVLN